MQQGIRDQGDLASLPQPRLICTSPAWFRWFATGMLVVGACLAAYVGGRVIAAGAADTLGYLTALASVVAMAVCASMLVWGRPLDWRSWIGLAATRDGLYLVARARGVVFVPWRDVLELAVVRLPTARGVQPYARLKLRLPEESWARFGPVSEIEGTGAVRTYLVSSLAVPGDEVIAGLRAFRAEHADGRKGVSPLFGKGD